MAGQSEIKWNTQPTYRSLQMNQNKKRENQVCDAKRSYQIYLQVISGGESKWSHVAFLLDL